MLLVYAAAQWHVTKREVWRQLDLLVSLADSSCASDPECLEGLAVAVPGSDPGAGQAARVLKLAGSADGWIRVSLLPERRPVESPPVHENIFHGTASGEAFGAAVPVAGACQDGAAGAPSHCVARSWRPDRAVWLAASPPRGGLARAVAWTDGLCVLRAWWLQAWDGLCAGLLALGFAGLRWPLDASSGSQRRPRQRALPAPARAPSPAPQHPAAPRAPDPRLAIAAREWRELLRQPRQMAPQQLRHALAETLAWRLQAGVVFFAETVRGAPELRFHAGAGPARGYVDGLCIRSNPDSPEGQGPGGVALRSGRVAHCRTDEPAFAPWRERARAFGLEGMYAAVSCMREGSRLLLCVGYMPGKPVEPGTIEALQPLLDELARSTECQREVERIGRCKRYQAAWASLQPRLRDVDSLQALRGLVREHVLERTDACAIEWFAALPSGVTLQSLAAAAMCSGDCQVERLLAWPDAGRMRTQAARTRVPAQLPLPAEHGGGVLLAFPLLDGLGGQVGVATLLSRSEQPVESRLLMLLGRMLGGIAETLWRVHDVQAGRWPRMRDELTGLHSRQGLLQGLEAWLEQPGSPAPAGGAAPTLWVLRIDGWDDALLRWGEDAAQSLLYAFAVRLRDALPDAECIARVGAAEFAFVIEGLRGEIALPSRVQRLCRALGAQGGFGAAAGARLGVRLGIAPAWPGHGSAMQWLARACSALPEVGAQPAWGQWAPGPRQPEPQPAAAPPYAQPVAQA